MQWLRWEVRPWHTATGELGGIVIFTEDITEHKQAEDEIKRYMEELRASNNELTASTAPRSTVNFAWWI